MSVADGRAHIEARGVHDPTRSRLVADLKAAVEKLDGVQWAEVDAIVGRVVVVFDPDAIEPDDLVETIEAVEDLHDVRDERFPHDRADHPADREPLQRQFFAVGADLLGFGYATAAQALRFAPIPAEIPGIVSLVDSQPRVRRFLENRVGRTPADLSLATANALAQAVGQGPIGLVVDLAHRGGIIGELRARQAVWERREPELVHGRGAVRHAALDFPARPTPLPHGPIERYADRAAIGSLGAFGIALGVTRNPRRAADLLLTSIPKAANLGREAFASNLDRSLAGHGVIVMDTDALRRLDRVDCVLLEADLLMSGNWVIDDLAPFHAAADPVEATVRARSLFDPRDPKRTTRRGAWTLAPFDADGPTPPPGAKSRARLLGRGGRRVLGLWQGDDLVALVAAIPEAAPLVPEILARIEALDVPVHLVGGSRAFGRSLGIESHVSVRGLVQEIRDFQDEGHVVLLVGGRAHGALRAADVALGVEVPGERMPWGAHLMVGAGLGNVWRVVDAIGPARDVSRRSALLATGGASTGGIWAFAGPATGAASRALVPINGSAILSIAMGTLAARQVALRRPPNPGPRTPWHELEPAEILDRLASTPEGLEPAEQKRRRANGAARAGHEPVGLLRATADELANPLTPLLGLGAGLSAAVGSVTDAALVGGVMGVNALVGAVQRVQTERALVVLEERGRRPAQVRSGAGIVEVGADHVVVGDVVELRTGDIVPADCRILTATNLEMDDSSITGESLPVAKSADPTPGAPVAERTCILYEGTCVVTGEATAVVVAVGVDTEAGRSAQAAAGPPPSGVEQRLGALTRSIIPVTLGAGAAVTGLGFLYRRSARVAVGAGVSLMVAAVPEGLPALSTLAQVASARRLSRRGALVRNPRAIEALGRVDQICFDKTGTLTEGRIALVAVSDGVDTWAVDALPDHGLDVLASALRASPDGTAADLTHATDRAVVHGAAGAGVDADRGLGDWERIDELPFQSRHGYHAVLGGHATQGRFIVVKGAPEVVLPRVHTWRRTDGAVPMDAAARHAVEREIHRLASRGLRVLAVAQATAVPHTDLADGTPDEGFELLGFVGLADPVRGTAREAVDRLRTAGIRMAMVTGDHPSTAEAIATELGLIGAPGDTGSPHRVLTGADLDQLADDELDAIVEDVAVFARVAPVQKVRIVEAYQRVGRAVAMTGDGANDAAAIRLADAGIALGGRANAAARMTADVVVVDDRIETIVDAIVEGRAMWRSVRDAVAILVGGNLGEVAFTVAGAALTGSAPLNARQLLLVNLLTDMAPALAIALREPRDTSPEALLHAGPDASLGTELTREIALRAVTTAVGATAAWGIGRFTGTPTRARTIALAGLVGTQLGQTLVTGGRSPIVLASGLVSTVALFAAVQTPGVSQFFGCRPMGPIAWTTAIGASAGATAASVAAPRAVQWAHERLTRGNEGMTIPFPDLGGLGRVRSGAPAGG